MSSSDPSSNLAHLFDQARRLVRRSEEYLDDWKDGRAALDDVEPLLLALKKLDELLRDGTEVAAGVVRGDRGHDAPTPSSRVAAILEVTRALAHTLDEDALREIIMDLVIQYSKAERGVLFLTEPGGGLTIRAARNVDHTTIPSAEREISQTIVDRVRTSGEALLVPNALDDASLRLKESVLSLRILSVLAAPLRLQAEIVGVVYLESRSVKGLFTEDDRSFLQLFCEQAAIALGHARVFQEARQSERRLTEENARLRAEMSTRHSFNGIIGRSRPMQEIYGLVERVGPKRVNVLIRGENGTGKELVARVIHFAGSSGPFISMNCAAIPETLIESELFGIEKGTATGVDARPGKFEVASGGTLFLDEVGDMSLVVQAKLLRVLQEKEIERVGGRKPIKVDVRIIAATNIDLETAISEKRFREDLYYRLNVVDITLPPLRDRVEDIPLLASQFVRRLSDEFQAEDRRLTPAALECLCRYEWPGNVRQLENALSRAIVLSQTPELGVDLLPADIRAAGRDAIGPDPAGSGTLEDLERSAVVHALEKHGWIQTRAALDLGISERNLRYKMQKFGIRRPEGGRGGLSGSSATLAR
jgi:Nif-specific regulatory protein